MQYKFLALILIFFIGVGAYSQNKLSGIIVDEKSKSPLVGVTVVNSNSGKGTISETNGEFNILIDEFPIVFSFRHLGYFEDSLRIENGDDFSKYYKGKILNIRLRINPFKLDEVVVSTPGMAIKLFGEEPYSIIDYVVKDNRFIALGYKNNSILNSEIILGNLSGSIILSRPLKSFQEVYQACSGEVYAITKDSATHIGIQNDSILFYKACKPTYFEDNIRPIQAKNDSCYIYMLESEMGLCKDYYTYSIDNQNNRLFYRVGDHGNEIGYTNLDGQIRSQVVGKIKKGDFKRGEMRPINDRISRQMFQRHDEYKPVNSEIFQLIDNVLLFDFEYQEVHLFTINADLLWSTQLQVELNNDFTGRVHHDKITNKFFLEFLNVRLSYLIEIDPLTGEEIQTIPIQKLKHIDHISVYNNRIFFLHQPDFGDRGKKIYFLDI